MGGEASLSASTHILLVVMVVELLLALAWNRFILTHVHLLLDVGLHRALLLFVAGELVWVNHRKHLREALTNARDSLRWVSEGKFIPWHELNTLTVHVDETLLATGAGEATKWLLAEHGVLFVLTTIFAHDQVVQILELFLVDL